MILRLFAVCFLCFCLAPLAQAETFRPDPAIEPLEEAFKSGREAHQQATKSLEDEMERQRQKHQDEVDENLRRWHDVPERRGNDGSRTGT